MSTFSSKNTTITTASFVSHLNPVNSRQVVYLTHDDLQKRTASLYSLFIFCYLAFLGSFSLIYAIIAASAPAGYSAESTMCKACFFFDLSIVLFLNLAVTVFLCVKYAMFQKAKQTDNMTMLKDPRTIITQASFMFFVFLSLGHASRSSCQPDMFWRVSTLFFAQLLQTCGMCIANFLYHYKICVEFEMSVALDEESQDKETKKEAQFNGSFALNLSRMSKSNRDKLKHRRRRPVKQPDFGKIELDGNIKDLDSLRAVKKSPNKALGGLTETPTKRLDSEFMGVDVTKTC